MTDYRTQAPEALQARVRELEAEVSRLSAAKLSKRQWLGRSAVAVLTGHAALYGAISYASVGIAVGVSMLELGFVGVALIISGCSVVMALLDDEAKR